MPRITFSLGILGGSRRGGRGWGVMEDEGGYVGEGLIRQRMGDGRKEMGGGGGGW